MSEQTTRACRLCARELCLGETAWADDWTVIDATGSRTEVRYTCDDCAPPAWGAA